MEYETTPLYLICSVLIWHSTLSSTLVGATMASPTVTHVSSCLIAPSTPTPSHHMFLSAIDIVWRWFHYNQRILFYKLDPSLPDAFGVAVDRLKSSLSDVLVEFYPWAARLFEQADGRLAMDCNDAGVEFIEASIDVPFSSLEEDGFQYKSFFKHLAPLGHIRKWTGPELPLLSIQVTRFPQDEGLVLGIAQSHVVADGSSVWHFMKSWGECARGVPISMRPLHMRTELAPGNLILPPGPHDPQARSLTQGAVFGRGPDQELAQRDFHFSAEMMRKLKQIASEGTPHSSFQALCAHIWKHVTAARAVSESAKSGIFVIANMRSRLAPPLPEAFFGNAVLREVTSATAGELQEESLAAIAMRVQDLIASLNDHFFKSFLGKIEVLEPQALLQGLDFSMLMLHVSSSPRFPVYDVEFGWGKPLCVRSPFIHGDGEMVLFPGREGGGSVDVSLALSKPFMERLEQDKGFLFIE